MDIPCPHCNSVFSAHLWVIVDLTESPELIPSIRDDSIHSVVCTRCGQGVGQADVPLLIYRPGYRPPVLFSPCFDTTADDLKETCAFLMDKLRESLGSSWKDEGIAVVFRPGLGRVLTADMDETPRRKK
jgi:hypothetical protein